MPRPRLHVDDAVAVGRRLQDARQAAGLTQRQLAFEGCTAAYISRIEKGERVPSLQVLTEFAKRLAVSASYLASGQEEDAISRLLGDGQLAARLGNLDEAEAIFRELLANDLGPAEARSASMGLAEVSARRGDYSAVVDVLAPLIKDVDDPDESAWAADRLGRAYAHLGEYESSLAVFERAFSTAHDRQNEPAKLRFGTLLANAYLDSGNVGRAEEFLAQALTVAEGVRDPLDLARLWWSQSRLHIQEGRPEIAGRYARKAIDVLDASEHAGFASAAYQLLAHIENDRGNGREALELLDRGEPAVELSGDRYYKALFSLERARALALIGEVDEAGSIAMNAVGLLQQIDPSDASHGFSLLAAVYRQLGDDSRSLELYELALERLPENDAHRAEIYAALGELFEAAGRTEDALGAYKAAAELRRPTRVR